MDDFNAARLVGKVDYGRPFLIKCVPDLHAIETSAAGKTAAARFRLQVTRSRDMYVFCRPATAVTPTMSIPPPHHHHQSEAQ